MNQFVTTILTSQEVRRADTLTELALATLVNTPPWSV